MLPLSLTIQALMELWWIIGGINKHCSARRKSSEHGILDNTTRINICDTFASKHLETEETKRQRELFSGAFSLQQSVLWQKDLPIYCNSVVESGTV
jgi:hypothetical protein